jgi:5-methylcytosine-specific restriction endonuclease McrA
MKRYETPNFNSIRKQVYKRDNYTCQICYAKNIRLNAHHIQRWADCPTLRDDPNNLITLCWRCHRDMKGKEKSYAEMFMRKVDENNAN